MAGLRACSLTVPDREQRFNEGFVELPLKSPTAAFGRLLRMGMGGQHPMVESIPCSIASRSRNGSRASHPG